MGAEVVSRRRRGERGRKQRISFCAVSGGYTPPMTAREIYKKQGEGVGCRAVGVGSRIGLSMGRTFAVGGRGVGSSMAFEAQVF